MGKKKKEIREEEKHDTSRLLFCFVVGFFLPHEVSWKLVLNNFRSWQEFICAWTSFMQLERAVPTS